MTLSAKSSLILGETIRRPYDVGNWSVIVDKLVSGADPGIFKRGILQFWRRKIYIEKIQNLPKIGGGWGGGGEAPGAP